jgi:polyhydroxyalkanoate synthesis regulator phasin
VWWLLQIESDHLPNRRSLADLLAKRYDELMREDAIPLEAEITVSQLREEETLGRALERYHRVRLRRYSDVVGVVVDASEWHRLTSLIATLEQQVADLEEANLRALVARRAERAHFERGEPGRTAAILDEVEAEVLGGGAPN